MVKNHHLAYKIEHQAWYEFRCKLEWYNKQLIVVDFKNTLRICSSCDAKNHDFDNPRQNQ